MKKVDDSSISLRSISITFDGLTFTETWITDKGDATYIPGHRSEHLCHGHKKGGGLAISFTDTFTHAALDDFSVISSYIECLTLRIGKSVVVAVYRRHMGIKSIFYNFLTDCLHLLQFKTCPM